jgi:hypothetical protein
MPMQPPGSDVTVLKNSWLTWAMISITAVQCKRKAIIDEQKKINKRLAQAYLDPQARQ